MKTNNRGAIDPPLMVSDAAFEYLRLQKGSLDRFASDRKLWEELYSEDLARTYEEVAPFLPATCWGMLDIGSGLGGIDVLLSRHYVARGQRAPFVNLLDGENDPPEMRLHRETFNDMRVARDFLKANGIEAEKIATYGPDAKALPKPYDLICSFGSWCFHYPPAVYLPLLLAPCGLRPESVLIVDVRIDKPGYWQELLAHLEFVATIRAGRKYNRVAFQWRGE